MCTIDSPKMPDYGDDWLFSSDMHVPNLVGAKYDTKTPNWIQQTIALRMRMPSWAETTPVAFHPWYWTSVVGGHRR